jgi:carbon monoxide dehydrogenase subunit G
VAPVDLGRPVETERAGNGVDLDRGKGLDVQIENTIEIPATPEQVWDYLLDVERVAPCMPGAELTEVVDDQTWRGKVAVKVGPVSLSFAGTVVLKEKDVAHRTVVLKADGKETKGKGSASALMTSRLEDAADGSTRVVVATDLSISGALAQFGRGMIADVSQRMAGQFARCLAARMAAEAAGPAGPGGGAKAAVPLPTAAEPVGGIRLALWALVRAIWRAIARLGRAIASPFGRR